MSTFTDWNGPQRPNIRAGDLAEYAERYASLVAKLERHLAETVSGDNAHSAKDFISGALSDYMRTADALDRLSAHLTKVEAEREYAKKGDLAELARKGDIPSVDGFLTGAALEGYLRREDLASDDVIAELRSGIEELEAWANGESVRFRGAVRAATWLEGMVRAVGQAEMAEREFQAEVGGSDDVGVYYVLGMTLSRAGTAYIRFSNTRPFSAAVTWAVTPSWTGELAVVTDSTLAGLKFKLVRGTGDGERAYLAVQSSEWIQNFASTDGVGKFATIRFYASGLNFVPPGGDGWVRPVASCHDIASCMAGAGLSASRFSTAVLTSGDGSPLVSVVEDGGAKHLVLGDRTYRDIRLLARPYLVKADGSTSPFLTADDISALDSVGTVSAWPKFRLREDGAAVATGFPGAYLACDGSEFDRNEHPELFEALGSDRLPLIDFHVVMARALVDVIDDFNAAGGDLARAVATLHETDIYDSAAKLPTGAAKGAVALVRKDGAYYVYVRTDDGWEVK